MNYSHRIDSSLGHERIPHRKVRESRDLAPLRNSYYEDRFDHAPVGHHRYRDEEPHHHRHSYDSTESANHRGHRKRASRTHRRRPEHGRDKKGQPAAREAAREAAHKARDEGTGMAAHFLQIIVATFVINFVSKKFENWRRKKH